MSSTPTWPEVTGHFRKSEGVGGGVLEGSHRSGKKEIRKSGSEGWVDPSMQM